MRAGLLTYIRKYVAEGKAGFSQLTCPVLVWDSRGETPAEFEDLAVTTAGGNTQRPAAGESLILEVRKGAGKMNAFAMGVTIGRTENNDIPLPDLSISRFHAYLQQNAKTGVWKLVDAESKNGSWIGQTRLLPNQGVEIADKTRMKFGVVEVQFLEPASFIEHLRQIVG